MENLINLINGFNSSLIENFNLLYKANNLFVPKEEELKFLVTENSILHENFKKFYSEIGTYRLSWQNTLKLPEDVRGEVKIISIIKALSDWRDVVYFDDNLKLKNFKIMDQFSNEACCGFYTQDEKNASSGLVYYYDFSGTPVSLQLTPQEYMEMMVEAKGFLYWQKVLIDQEKGNDSPQVVLMKEQLVKVFPDFKYDSFIEKFKSFKNN